MTDPRVDANGELPGADHVIRYCSFQRLRPDGSPSAAAFFPDDDNYISVYWLEFGGIVDDVARWNDMRARMTASGITLRGKGKLAKLSVGRTKSEVLAQFDRQLNIRHMPVLNDGGVPPDASHCGIHGMRQDDLEVADFIASKLVLELRPAKT